MFKAEDEGKRTGIDLNFFLQYTPRMRYVVLLLIQNNMFLRLGVANTKNTHLSEIVLGNRTDCTNQGLGSQWHLHGALRRHQSFCLIASATRWVLTSLSPGLCLGL